MIAKLSISFAGRQFEVILTDRGKWYCDLPYLRDTLTDDFKVDFSPSMGSPGSAAVHKAAKELGGKIVFLKEYPEGDKDTIY